MLPELNHVCLCAAIRLTQLCLFSETNRCMSADFPDPLAPTMNNLSPCCNVKSIESPDTLGIPQFIVLIIRSLLLCSVVHCRQTKLEDSQGFLAFNLRCRLILFYPIYHSDL